MNIELKNVKIVKSLSRETMCFEAVVYVNGKKAFITSNEGCGGDNIDIPIDHDLYNQAVAYAKSLPRITKYNIEMNLNLLMMDLIGEYELEQRFLRMSKTKTLFSVPGVSKEGEYMTINKTGQDAVDYIKTKYPTAIFWAPRTKTK